MTLNAWAAGRRFLRSTPPIGFIGLAFSHAAAVAEEAEEKKPLKMRHHRPGRLRIGLLRPSSSQADAPGTHRPVFAAE